MHVSKYTNTYTTVYVTTKQHPGPESNPVGLGAYKDVDPWCLDTWNAPANTYILCKIMKCEKMLDGHDAQIMSQGQSVCRQEQNHTVGRMEGSPVAKEDLKTKSQTYLSVDTCLPLSLLLLLSLLNIFAGFGLQFCPRSTQESVSATNRVN